MALRAGYMRDLALKVQCCRIGKVEREEEQSMRSSPWFVLASRI